MNDALGIAINDKRDFAECQCIVIGASDLAGDVRS